MTSTKKVLYILRFLLYFRQPNYELMIKDIYLNYTSFIKKYKLQPIVDVAIFAVIIIFFHYIWWHGFKSFLQSFAAFNQVEAFLAHQVYLPSAWIVENILNYPITTNDSTNTLFFPNHGYIVVEGSCSGLKQFYQWTILMLLFPGPWKKKLWFIPAGLLVIHIVNILRIVILSIVVVHWPQQWDFIHMWILRPFFYVVIFGMWVVWVEKVRIRAKMRGSE